MKQIGTTLDATLISKGNVEWVPSGNHNFEKPLLWSKFAALIANEGRASAEAEETRAGTIRVTSELLSLT